MKLIENFFGNMVLLHSSIPDFLGKLHFFLVKIKYTVKTKLIFDMVRMLAYKKGDGGLGLRSRYLG